MIYALGVDDVGTLMSSQEVMLYGKCVFVFVFFFYIYVNRPSLECDYEPLPLPFTSGTLW